MSVFYWLPRVLSILFVIFITLFALDVFGPDFSWIALLMHLLPTLLLAALTWVAWRREYLGGLIYIGLGMFYILLAWGKASVITYLIISGPLFLAGVLFMLQTRLAGKALVKESALAILILFLLFIDGTALNDIAQHEPNLIMEYTALAVSLVIFGVLVFWEIRIGNELYKG